MPESDFFQQNSKILLPSTPIFFNTSVTGNEASVSHRMENSRSRALVRNGEERKFDATRIENEIAKATALCLAAGCAHGATDIVLCLRSSSSLVAFGRLFCNSLERKARLYLSPSFLFCRFFVDST